MRLILIYFLHVVHGIWEDICQWLHISRRITTVRSGLKWMKKDVHVSSGISRARRVAFQSMVYMTWTTRNKVLKEWLCLNPQLMVIQIQLHVYISKSLYMQDFRSLSEVLHTGYGRVLEMRLHGMIYALRRTTMMMLYYART